MANWIYRINVIIPADDEAAYNALWTIIAPGGDVEADTFGIPCSPTGNAPGTHLAISTAATQTMYLLISDTYAAELAGAAISVQDYTQNDIDALLAREGLVIING